MKSRFIKKLMHTPADRLAPRWYKAICRGNDAQLEKAFRCYREYGKKQTTKNHTI